MKIFSFPRVNTSEHMPEAESVWLISECIAGNEDAIEMLVRQYEADIFRLALSILGDQAEANEITQETFISALRAFRSYQDYQDRKSLKAWLYTIALNHSRSRLRRRKILERLQTTLTAIFRIEAKKQASPEEAVIQTEQEAVLWNALNNLDERHRVTVILRYFHELSVAEISEVLSVNEGTIHSRLHAAREKLRNALQHLHGE